MKFEDLREEDKHLIKSAMLHDSVSMTSEALNCKEVMPIETYKKQLSEADRLIYLLNVLNGVVKYN